MTDRTPRPLLRRMRSFREPLFLIPFLLRFLASSINSFFHNYSSFLHSFARSFNPSTKCTCPPVHDEQLKNGSEHEHGSSDVEEEEQTLSREEVEEILERIGLAVSDDSERLEACMGYEEVSCVFQAEEPSFEEVKRAFAVFDGDGDGFIGETDLQKALERLGFQEDAGACRWMIDASCHSKDGRMNLFQFVKFLESGFC